MHCVLDPERRDPRRLERARFESPLGEMVGVFEAEALAGLYFVEDQKYVPADTHALPLAGDRPAVHALRSQLARYFDPTFHGHRGGHPIAFDVRLHLRGTPFQLRVWDALRSIPAGETRTYGAIAASIGASAAVRAVGAAIGRNPVSLIVPCHRVIGANGSLTGYAGGVRRKAWLLAREGVSPQARLPGVDA
ncbi:MAG: methylated-DNA--[protein]-cysteine S-methyltransferase [Lautropia sp.]